MSGRISTCTCGHCTQISTSMGESKTVRLVHGPEVVYWGETDIFADKGFPWFFDQIYLEIEEKSGEPYFRLRFWTPESYKVKLSFIFTSSLKICIRSWCWLNVWLNWICIYTKWKLFFYRILIYLHIFLKQWKISEILQKWYKKWKKQRIFFLF